MMITFLYSDHLLIRFQVSFMKVYPTIEFMSILLICDTIIWKVFNERTHKQFITAQMMIFILQST